MSNKIRVGKHNGVVSGTVTVKLFGSRLDVFVYITNGLLVDTGPSNFSREFRSFFENYAIEQAVLTHHHEDHSGNAVWLQKKGVPVYVHKLALSVCEKPANLPLYRRLFWGKREGFTPTPLPEFLRTGKKVLQVIETPGHSFDHVAYFDAEEGAVFTGDLFVTPKTKLCLRWENACEIMDSLEKVLRLGFETVYCGHAGVIENGRELLRMKLDYLENLRGEVLHLHNQGWDIKSINKKYFPKTAPLKYLSFNEWSSEYLISSLITNSAEKQY